MYDYIVIGSGPSGGNLSYNLNKAGAKVLLVEAGKFHRKDTFPKTEAEGSAQLYWGGGLEFDSTAHMAFLRARVVGGTSIVNQCLLDRFDDIAFNDWKDESGVDFFSQEAMKPHYDAVERMLHIHTFEDYEMNGNAQLFTKSCNSLGHKWSHLHRGQTDCALEEGNDCIACLSGCHRDSKQSSLVGYVQRAEKEGLEVVSETEVSYFDIKPEEVSIHAMHKGEKVMYKGKNLVLAAGSFGTTKLMYMSGMKKKLPTLGLNFSSHPQFMTYGVFQQTIDSHKGAFQTVASKDPNFRQKGFKLENVFAPPISAAMLFNQMGKDHMEIMRNYRRTQCIEVAVRDENAGEIKVDRKGKMTVTKPLTDQDKARRDIGKETIRNILWNAGAKRVIESPYYFGLHLMGGCVIGTDEEKSVVGPDFRVHGHKNLFIADSSIYPNAPGINPSLTIFALSQKLSSELTESSTTTAHVEDTEPISTESPE